MTISLTPQKAILSFAFLVLLTATVTAQVGINTTAPAAGAILDVESTDKGMLVPRVNIIDLSTIAPITGGSTESLLVYNTNVGTGKGFYHWNGSQWVVVGDGRFWKLDGNAGTTPGTGAGQNYVGTSDPVDLVLGANDNEVARITSAGTIEAANNGTAADPVFTFSNDPDTGMYRAGGNRLSFTTNASERFSILSNGNFRAYTSGTEANPLYSWNGDTNMGIYRPGADVLGLVTNGNERLRIPNSNQIFAMASGTAAAPFYSFNANQNMGIYRAGTNRLGLVTTGIERLRIPNANQIHAMSRGSIALPFYSFNTDANTGIWSATADQLNLTAGAVEFIRLREGGTDELVINEASVDINTRIETNGQQNMVFVDGGTNRVGIMTNSPQAALHVAGASSTLRIDELNSTNSAFNNGIDNSVVLVNSNGELVLQDAVDDFPIDASDTGTGANSFLASPIALTSNSGALVVASAYSTTITLTRTTLIEVAFWTGVNLARSNSSFITDGKPRLFGGLVQHNGSGTDIVYSANSYSNSGSSGTVTTGYFTVGGNGFITLPAGSHTIELLVFASGGESGGGPTQGVRATFGANSFNRFQIIYHN